MQLNPAKMLVLLFLSVSFSSSAQVQPDSSESDSSIQAATVVAIPTDDEYYIGKEIVARADISRHLRQIFNGKIEPVYIKAACQVKYGTVVLLMDELRQAGFDKIGLVADKKKPAGRSSPKTSTPTNNASISKNIPSSEPRTGPVSLKVRSKTAVALDGVSTRVSVLKDRLNRVLKKRSDTTVVIEAPAAMDYCVVVNFIDRVKDAGATPIVLRVTESN